MGDDPLRMSDIWKMTESNRCFLLRQQARRRNKEEPNNTWYFSVHLNFNRNQPTSEFPPVTFSSLKHQLHASDDFIELIIAKFRIRLAKVRPCMEVVHHQFKIVAANIIIQTADN